MAEIYTRAASETLQPESMPEWLSLHKAGDRPYAEVFFTSRVVFCPSATIDFDFVSEFVSRGAAHSFFCVDNGYSESMLHRRLSNRLPGGYSLVDTVHLQEADLFPNGFHCHLSPSEFPNFRVEESVRPYCDLCIFEREEEGRRDRFSILFLSADSYLVYDALFCGERRNNLYAVVLRGARGAEAQCQGAMEIISERSGTYPDFILTYGAAPWKGYVKIYE